MSIASRLLLLCIALACANGCQEHSAAQNKEPGGFAADRAPKERPAAAPFDGKRAMTYLERICEIGPRMSGTRGMRDQQDLIRKHFEDLGQKVEAQRFKATQVSTPEPVDMTNLIVRYHPERKRRIIFCTHYDTRPIADQEPDPRKWREKFVSANDGGSGVALLMELAHHMPKLTIEVGVDFVFFDGEEYIWDRDKDKYFLGSEHFAKTWRADPKRPDYLGAVLMDMIAGKNPRFPVEVNSYRRATALTTQLWYLAAELKLPAFRLVQGHEVNDDHIALLNVGIPAVDIIDFDYPHWHRLTDTPANCSADGMEQVSKLLTVWAQTLK
jgi:hypothetical protein